jgi:hypothetical protein
MNESLGTPPPTAARPDTSLRAAVDNPYAILALLFFVTGFFGLPALWMSRAFTPGAKIVLSIVVTIYTLLLIGCTVGVLWWAWSMAMAAL